MIEIYLMVSLAPIPFSTFGNREQSQIGQNYLRSLMALAFQGFLIMICVGIYAVLIQSVYNTDYTTYEIPSEALSDEAFANMIAEAEKYLGYPYVWGGSSPSTSFDCSGFVSWVINNCGNGWSVGRQTANGLLNLCTVVSASDAQPGDLIFFQGTYNTSGASHVGIYVGNGMMIHCGDPIQYTSINTSYWQSHFLAYGRLPGM